MPEKIPEQITGQPEAGLQQDIFGDTHLFTPQVKDKVTQISMDDALKLQTMNIEWAVNKIIGANQ